MTDLHPTIHPCRKWSDHNSPFPNLISYPLQDFFKRDFATGAGRGPLIFLITVGGLNMTPITAGFRSHTQLRAEQAAVAYTKSRYTKDNRPLSIIACAAVE